MAHFEAEQVILFNERKNEMNEPEVLRALKEYHAALKECGDERDALRARVDSLTAALEKYADEDNWLDAYNKDLDLYIPGWAYGGSKEKGPDVARAELKKWERK